MLRSPGRTSFSEEKKQKDFFYSGAWARLCQRPKARFKSFCAAFLQKSGCLLA
jgi:hypothetical protein